MSAPPRDSGRLRPSPGTSPHDPGRGAAEAWHARVEGTWHGFPALFDAKGVHLGHVRADRSIFEDESGRIIVVRTAVDCAGILRARLEHPEHRLRVKHDGDARVYVGPDFYGAGLPYGSLVLGNDYCLPWTSDNRVTVHVLPDGKTQAYSTLLYQGPALHAVINGVYRLSNDYDTNPQTRTDIDAFVVAEKARANQPFQLPARRSGMFRGELEVYDPYQKHTGAVSVAIRHTPTGFYDADWFLQWDGPLPDVPKQLEFRRRRYANEHFFEGPDVFGNAIGYGRALYTTCHVAGHNLRIRGRDFIVGTAVGETAEGDLRMSAVWEIFRGDRLEHVLHGVLNFEGNDR